MKEKTWYTFKFESDHYDFRYWEHTICVVASSFEIAIRKAKKALKKELEEMIKKGNLNFKGMPVKIFISKTFRGGAIYD